MKTEGLSDFLLGDTVSDRPVKYDLTPVKPPPAKSEPELNLIGKRVVITGKLPNPRHIIEADLTNMGVVCMPRITKSVDYLIVGGAPGNTKLKQASKYGIPTITYREAVESLK